MAALVYRLVHSRAKRVIAYPDSFPIRVDAYSQAVTEASAQAYSFANLPSELPASQSLARNEQATDFALALNYMLVTWRSYSLVLVSTCSQRVT